MNITDYQKGVDDGVLAAVEILARALDGRDNLNEKEYYGRRLNALRNRIVKLVPIIEEHEPIENIHEMYRVFEYCAANPRGSQLLAKPIPIRPLPEGPKSRKTI